MTICITSREWITSWEPPELSQYTLKRVSRTTFKRVLLNHAPSSTQLHPHLSSLFQSPPSFIYFQPAHFSLHLALCNTLNNIRIKISYVIGQFPQIQVEKFKVVHFDWKLAHMVCWRYWFRIQTLIFKIETQKSIFGQIWAQNVKVVCFVWKLAHMVSQGCWFLIQH